MAGDGELSYRPRGRGARGGRLDALQLVNQMSGSTGEVPFQEGRGGIPITLLQRLEQATMFPIESLPVLEHEPVREPVAVHPSQETGDQLLKTGPVVETVDGLVEFHVQRTPLGAGVSTLRVVE